MKSVIGGLLLLVVVSTASAGERAIEIWNPPEARLTHTAKTPHRVPAHRRISSHAALRKRRQVVTATVDKVKATDIPVETGKREPSFDDIPRQVTPEGNVLRVNDGSTGVMVTR